MTNDQWRTKDEGRILSPRLPSTVYFVIRGECGRAGGAWRWDVAVARVGGPASAGKFIPGYESQMR
jgi:hypothetical protein